MNVNMGILHHLLGLVKELIDEQDKPGTVSLVKRVIAGTTTYDEDVIAHTRYREVLSTIIDHCSLLKADEDWKGNLK